jgi:hypothetical protein
MVLRRFGRSKIPQGELSRLSGSQDRHHLRAWLYFVAALLTLPAYFGLLAILLRLDAPKWIANVCGIVNVISGFTLIGLSVRARSPFAKQTHMAFAFVGSYLAWILLGKALQFQFGHLIEAFR